MADREKVIKGLDALYKAMHENQCYACSYEFIENAKEFGTEIIADALALLESQPQIVRCKDCKHSCYCNIQELPPGIFVVAKCTKTNVAHVADWFCADGERRETDG